MSERERVSEREREHLEQSLALSLSLSKKIQKRVKWVAEVVVVVVVCVCVGGGGYSRKKCSEEEHAYGNKNTPRLLHRESRVPEPTSKKNEFTIPFCGSLSSTQH